MKGLPLDYCRDAALLGLERSPAPPEGHPPTVHEVLDGLARLYIYEKTAVPLPAPGNLPETDPAPLQDEGHCLSAASVQDFERMASGVYLWALPQFVALCTANGRTFPFAALPMVLDRCAKTPGLYPLLLPLLGPRAAWLMGLRRDWELIPDRAAKQSPLVPPGTEPPDMTEAEKLRFLAFYEKMAARIVVH